MSQSSSAVADLLVEHLAPLGAVRARRMFSGAGLFAGELMFGLIVDEVLYLKVDHETRGTFEAHGLSAFSYTRGDRIVELSYWRTPDYLLDEPDELLDWGRTALAAANRANRVKAAKHLPATKQRPAKK